MPLHRNITLFYFLVILCNYSFAQKEKTIAFTISSRYGQFIPHKPALNYLIQGKSTGLAFSIEKRKKDSIRYGLTASILNSGNPEVLGLVYGLNGFTSFPLTKKENGTRLRIGIGLGYVEKIFDPNTNNRNIVIGSHVNTKIVFRAEKEFLLWRNNYLNLGVGVCHFSNGAYQTPNLGINFLLLNLGYSWDKTVALKKEKKSFNMNYGLDRKWIYSIILSGGIRENPSPLREKYPIVNLCNRINYMQSTKNHFIGGIDFTYNPGILHRSHIPLEVSPVQSGIFIGNERNFDRITFAVDMGVYLFNQNRKSLLYHRCGIHYQLSNKIKILLQLKSHWAVAEAFEFGIKYRIK